MLLVQWGSQVVIAGNKTIANVYLHGNKGTQGVLLEKGVTLYTPCNLRKAQREEDHRPPLDRGGSKDPVNHLFEFPNTEKTGLAINAIAYETLEATVYGHERIFV